MCRQYVCEHTGMRRKVSLTKLLIWLQTGRLGTRPGRVHSMGIRLAVRVLGFTTVARCASAADEISSAASPARYSYGCEHLREGKEEKEEGRERWNRVERRGGGGKWKREGGSE